MMPVGAGRAREGSLLSAVGCGAAEGLKGTTLRPNMPHCMGQSFPSWNNLQLWDTQVCWEGTRGAGHVTSLWGTPPGAPSGPGRALGWQIRVPDPPLCPQEPITSGPGCQPRIPPSSSLRPDNVPIFLPAVASRRRTKPLLSAGSG